MALNFYPALLAMTMIPIDIYLEGENPHSSIVLHFKDYSRGVYSSEKIWESFGFIQSLKAYIIRKG